MRIRELISENLTSVGRKYEDLYTKYYKRAHLAARKKGLQGTEADRYANRALDAYKDRVRTGEWDPITKTKGHGRAEYMRFEDFNPHQTISEYLKSLPSLENTFVRSQGHPTLGINPGRSLQDRELPGMYAWPAAYFLRLPEEDVYAGNSHFVFTVTGNVVIGNNNISKLIDPLFAKGLNGTQVAQALYKNGVNALVTDIADDPPFVIREGAALILDTRPVFNVKKFSAE